MGSGLVMRRLVVVLLGLVLGAGLALVLQPGDAAPRTSTLPPTSARASTRARTPYVPRIKHVFVINIENKGYTQTWGAGSEAPYLAKRLRNKGVLLRTTTARHTTRRATTSPRSPARVP